MKTPQLLPFALFSAALAGLTPLAAQVAAPTSAEATPPEEIVELSPFVVQADADEGYAPNETLSGTRLRMQTRDVASSITILTSELMHDLGALTFNDVADFLPSTASYANNEGDQFNNGSRTGTPFIVRGYRSDSLSTDFFTSLTPIDTYNTARLTASRGPNSILFGVGNPGGLIDIVTNKADLRRNFGTVELRADSFDSFRTAVDANYVLIPQKLALRLDLLHDDRGVNIKPSRNERDSVFLAGTWQPTAGTTIHANAEHNQIRQQLPRPYVTFDWYSTWYNAGQPLVPTYASTTPRAGIEYEASNGYPVYIEDVGALDWSRSGRGARPLMNGTRLAQVSFSAASPVRVVPFDTYVMGDGDRVDLETDNVSVIIQQRLAEGLYLELGGKHEHSFRNNRESQGTGADNTIKVDANAQLPNKQPNPHAGQPFVELSGNYTVIPTDQDQLRATLAYEKDLSHVKVFRRGLGKFTIAGLYNNEATHQFLDNFRLVNDTPLPTSTPDLSSSRNLIRYRSYLADGNTYFRSTFPTFEQNGIKAAWHQIGTPRNNFTRIESFSIAGQALLFDQLLSLTAGLRRDEALVRQKNYPKDARGTYPTGSKGGEPGPEINSAGRPYLFGAVLNAHKNVAVFYNRSTNFQPVNQSFRTVNDDPLPAVTGRGFDTGAKFFLFNDRVTGSFAYFETQQNNVRDAAVNSSRMINPINSIWEAIDPTRRPESGWTDTKTTKTHGVEFQLVANPTRNLRLMLTGSRNVNLLMARGATTYAYLAANYPIWLEHASAPVSSSDGATVGELVAVVQQEEKDQRSVIGIPLTRVYEWQLNAVGRYQFDKTSVLDGFAVGSAVRWRSAPVIGFTRLGTMLDTSRPFEGKDSANMDLWVEYGRSLTAMGRKVRWSAQVRVQNVWDDRTLLPWTASDDGNGAMFVEQRRTPGEQLWVVSTSLAF